MINGGNGKVRAFCISLKCWDFKNRIKCVCSAGFVPRSSITSAHKLALGPFVFIQIFITCWHSTIWHTRRFILIYLFIHSMRYTHSSLVYSHKRQRFSGLLPFFNVLLGPLLKNNLRIYSAEWERGRAGEWCFEFCVGRWLDFSSLMNSPKQVTHTQL